MAPRTKLAPVRWTPPPNPHPVRRRGDTRSLPVLRTIPLPGAGPEHIAIDASGTMFTGLADGRILRVTPEGDVRTVTNTGGRPLGLELYGDDALVVCDAVRGLLEVQLANGTVGVLASSADGMSLRFSSNAAVASDGTIYFTQSSTRFGLDEYRGDLLEHSATGRLLRWRDGAAEVIAEGFALANGLVLTEDESSAIVAETGGYCLTHVELTGATAGTKSGFVTELPGFPDNLTRDEDGLIWIAMVTPRDPLLDWLLPRDPRLRVAVWAMPERLQPGERDVAWARAVDGKGATVHELRGWKVGFKAVTSVRRRGGTLFMGSFVDRAIGVVELPGESAA